VVLEALSLIAEHGLRVGDLAEAELHPEAIALLEQALDVGHALPLGLGEVVAAERLEHRPAARQVELQHPVGAPHVQVDRAVVDGGVAAGPLDGADHLAGARVDQDEAVRRSRPQRHPGRRVVVGAAGDEAGRALAQEPGVGQFLGGLLP